MKTVLVVIAAYRAARFLPVCFASVVNQVLPAGWRMRVVVVSDACDSTTRLLQCHDWPQESLRTQVNFYQTLDNVGPYLIRNAVIAVSKYETGRYPEAISIFDADDIMHPLYLASTLPLVEEFRGIVGTARTHFDDETGRVLGSYGFTNGVCVFHPDVWERLGSFRPWRIAADHDFIRRGEEAGVQLIRDHGPMFSRRIHGQSLTSLPESLLGGPERERLKRVTERYIVEGKLVAPLETVTLERVERV